MFPKCLMPAYPTEPLVSFQVTLTLEVSLAPCSFSSRRGNGGLVFYLPFSSREQELFSS